MRPHLEHCQHAAIAHVPNAVRHAVRSIGLGCIWHRILTPVTVALFILLLARQLNAQPSEPVDQSWNSNRVGQVYPTPTAQSQQMGARSEQELRSRSPMESALPGYFQQQRAVSSYSTGPAALDNSNNVVPAFGSGNLASGSLPNAGSVRTVSHEQPSSRTRTLLQPKSGSAKEIHSASGSTFQMLISVASSLAIVVGLFVGLAMLYRKSMAASLGKSLPKNVVQVLGRTALAPRQQVVLLRFGSKLVLVSMIQGEARTISEITDPLEVDQLSGYCESAHSSSSSSTFRTLLSQGVKA